MPIASDTGVKIVSVFTTLPALSSVRRVNGCCSFAPRISRPWSSSVMLIHEPCFGRSALATTSTLKPFSAWITSFGLAG